MALIAMQNLQRRRRFTASRAIFVSPKPNPQAS